MYAASTTKGTVSCIGLKKHSGFLDVQYKPVSTVFHESSLTPTFIFDLLINIVNSDLRRPSIITTMYLSVPESCCHRGAS